MTDHDVTIIGAGFGGHGCGDRAQAPGVRLGPGDLLILEREDDLGGTWHVNHYPGLAVDIASVTYSYSFEPNPHWEHWFARGSELKRYAEHVADKYDLRRHMRFGVSVEGARWDEDEQHWVVTSAADGERPPPSPRATWSPRPASSPSRSCPTSRACTTSPAR